MTNSTRNGTRNLMAAMRQIHRRTIAAFRRARVAAIASSARTRTDCHRWSTSAATMTSPCAVGGRRLAAIDEDLEMEARRDEFVDDAAQHPGIQAVRVGKRRARLGTELVARGVQ